MSSFPKQCLHYGVLAFSRAGEGPLPVRGSQTRKIIKKPTVFKLFQKKWCWRSSFGLHLFIFWRMLQLISLFWLQNLLWPHNSASSVTWRPRELRTTKRSQNDPKMIPKWLQNDSEMIPKWSQNDPKLIPKLSPNDPKMIPTWSQNDPKMIQKWSQNDPKMIPKWF